MRKTSEMLSKSIDHVVGHAREINKLLAMCQLYNKHLFTINREVANSLVICVTYSHTRN